mgnify:CR=1 FL=1
MVRESNPAPDVVFMDIHLADGSSFEIFEHVRIDCPIIFTTAYDEYALRAFKVNSVDYLLKPITYERLRRALEDCSHLFEAEPKNMVLKTSFGFQKLYFHDIEYAEAQNKRVVFYLRGDKVVETSEPLRSFEESLTVSTGFFKCHRSYLVYLPNVDHFNNNEIFTKSGRSIPIARGYGKAFQEAYFAHMFQEE